MPVCKIYSRVTDAGDMGLIGELVLKDGKITARPAKPEFKDELEFFLHDRLLVSINGKSREATAKSHPEEWFRSLPVHFNGMACQAVIHEDKK